jgi:peptidoglycan/xylan/chitin deacetylase (PgdA/CDA1 family)
VVKSNVIVGWKTVGDQLNDEMLSQIELPLHQPSIFRTVIDGRDFYQGIMPSIPQNMHFLEMMGGEVPQEVIAFPLTIKGKVVCVLYGDNGDRSLLMGDFEELKKVMLKASMALEMLILKKKILEMQGMHCHRHQEREARRRCYRCHQPICSACQARAFHHLFCSRLCIFLYVLSEALRRSLISLAALFAIPPLRAKEGRRWMAPLVFLVLLALAALSLPPRPSLYRGFARPSAEDICYSQSPADLASGADIRPSYLIGSASAQSASAIVPDLQASGKGAEVSHSRPTYRNSSYHRVGEGEGERAEEEAPDISRGDRNRKEMAMTFDGGGWANAALEILDTLHEKGISCTFFLTGEFIRRYPELVKQIVAEGHEVGNHTESHPHLTSFATNSRQELLPGVSRSFLWRELEEAEKLFFEVTGQQMVPYWRAPYGEQNAILRRWAKEIGYQHVSWTSDYRAKKSLDSLDWVADPAERLYCSAEDVRNRILGYGRANGGIVLMHLGTSRRCDQVHERLGEIIEGLQEKGYRLVKISELLEGREGEKQADPGGD